MRKQSKFMFLALSLSLAAPVAATACPMGDAAQASQEVVKSAKAKKGKHKRKKADDRMPASNEKPADVKN